LCAFVEDTNALLQM